MKKISIDEEIEPFAWNFSLGTCKYMGMDVEIVLKKGYKELEGSLYSVLKIMLKKLSDGFLFEHNFIKSGVLTKAIKNQDPTVTLRKQLKLMHLTDIEYYYKGVTPLLKDNLLNWKDITRIVAKRNNAIYTRRYRKANRIISKIKNRYDYNIDLYFSEDGFIYIGVDVDNNTLNFRLQHTTCVGYTDNTSDGYGEPILKDVEISKDNINLIGELYIMIQSADKGERRWVNGYAIQLIKRLLKQGWSFIDYKKE